MDVHDPRIDRERSALLLVDIQPDFLPGGALPTHDGLSILEPIGRLLAARPFGLSVATQDWHPRDHISFASNHPGHTAMDRIELYGHEQILWPDHCIQETPGARLHPDVDWSGFSAIIRKAVDPRVDSYSAIRNNWNPRGERPPTGLAGYLRERGVEQVFIAGLARDFCVRWSAEDCVDEGFSTFVLWDLSRPVDPASDGEVRDALECRGVRVLDSGQLPAARRGS
ncbi:MAG TPA: nicotinamidase [Gemmatimonadota bacterium]|nr:nicotinamidase [Gemmatimonadota bacterium]